MYLCTFIRENRQNDDLKKMTVSGTSSSLLVDSQVPDIRTQWNPLQYSISRQQYIKTKFYPTDSAEITICLTDSKFRTHQSIGFAQQRNQILQLRHTQCNGTSLHYPKHTLKHATSSTSFSLLRQNQGLELHKTSVPADATRDFGAQTSHKITSSQSAMWHDVAGRFTLIRCQGTW